MDFGSFFKKKKKEAEKGVNDVENMVKNEIQPENELEKIDHSLTSEKAELGNTKKGSGVSNQLQADEDVRLESSSSSNPEPMVSRSTVREITMNIDSELLQKAQAKGIDLSNTLEQQLRRMVSGA
ncbi:MAG: type II toxin-antitoxin system CcdA family antitoxin [Nitrososphaeraceae archaeon]